MKRWILLLIVILILCSGCAKTPELPERQPLDNAGDKVVVYRGEKSFPLSFTQDGEQQIQNGTYWYYELADAAPAEWKEQFYTYDLKRQELDGVANYADLNNQCFATNGSWPLFLNPAHTEYSLSNQSMVDKNIIEMAENQFFSSQCSGVVMVSDVWICDMDGDGGQETLFMAQNSVEEDTCYYFLGYTDGESCQGLYSFCSGEKSRSLKTAEPLVCDLNGDGKWSLLLYKEGDYESFTSYDFSGGNFVPCYEIIF